MDIHSIREMRYFIHGWVHPRLKCNIAVSRLLSDVDGILVTCTDIFDKARTNWSPSCYEMFCGLGVFNGTAALSFPRKHRQI